MARVLLFTGCVNRPVGYAPKPTGQGIASWFVDPDTGAVEAGPVYTDIVNPTYVTLSGDGSKLAVISETEDQATDTLSLFTVNAGTGELTLLGRQSTRGTTACHSTPLGQWSRPPITPRVRNPPAMPSRCTASKAVSRARR